MGRCPCPWCAIKKEDFYALGTSSDTADRALKVRRDNDHFRSLVEEARDNIYRSGYALHSKPGVESLLKEESLVPTLVSYSILSTPTLHSLIFESSPECIFPLPQKVQIRCIPHSRCRPHARVRTWGMEGPSHAYHPDTPFSGCKTGPGIQLPVRTCLLNCVVQG